MKNAIQFLHAALRNRPNEQRIPIPQHFVKQLMKGIEKQGTEILTLESKLRESIANAETLDAWVSRLKAENATLESELDSANARIVNAEGE